MSDELEATFTVKFSASDSRLLALIAKHRRTSEAQILSEISGAHLWQKHVEETMIRLRSRFGELLKWTP